MAAIGWELAWAGTTGEYVRAHGASWQAVFRVFTNSFADQAKTIVDYVKANIVAPGGLYTYAADAGEIVARARRFVPEREMMANDVWLVTVYYEPDELTPDEGEDWLGTPVENPFVFQPFVEWKTTRYTKAAEKVIYRGGFHGQADALRGPLGKVGACVNSALQEFNPGLERDDVREIVEVQQYKQFFDADTAQAFINALNVAPFSITKWGFTLHVAKHCGKIGDIKATRRRQNGKDFWDVFCSIEIDRNTWHQELVDRGVAARAMPGDPDGRGGTISYSDLIPGVPQARRLVDPDETPVSDPILLDGDGQPLAPGANPVFVKYQTYIDEVNFKALPFLTFILD